MPPVVAVVSAVASVSAGATLYAAGSELIGGLMIAGGVASGLGAITGNKTLQTVGMVAGIAGGIAGFATGAWDNVAGGLAKDSMSNTASMNPGDMDQALASQTAAGGGVTGAQSVASQMASAGDYMSPGDADQRLASQNMAGGSGGMIDAARAPNMSAGANQPAAANTAADTPAPRGNAQDSAPSQVSKPESTSKFESARAASDSSGDNYSNAGSAYASPAQADQDLASQTASGDGVVSGARQSGSFFDRLKSVPKFIEQNKETAKLAGGLISGAMKSYGDQAALRDKYALEDEYLRRQRQQYSDSVRNLKMPSYYAPQRG